MNTSSRRSFLAVTGVTAAGIGAAAILPGSAEAQTSSGQAMSLQTVEAEVGVSLDDTVLLACVNDHEQGEVTVINGDAEITVIDHALARHIARLAGNGG